MDKARRRGALGLAALSLMATSAIVPASMADPAFGPGNKGGGVGNSGPQVGKCHPPGQRRPRRAASDRRAAGGLVRRPHAVRLEELALVARALELVVERAAAEELAPGAPLAPLTRPGGERAQEREDEARDGRHDRRHERHDRSVALLRGVRYRLRPAIVAAA